MRCIVCSVGQPTSFANLREQTPPNRPRHAGRPLAARHWLRSERYARALDPILFDRMAALRGMGARRCSRNRTRPPLRGPLLRAASRVDAYGLRPHNRHRRPTHPSALAVTPNHRALFPARRSRPRDRALRRQRRRSHVPASALASRKSSPLAPGSTDPRRGAGTRERYACAALSRAAGRR